MRIEYLYRYPVKGLTAEALDEAEVEAGQAIPWDRAFALAHGDAGFDPANPSWLPKCELPLPDEARQGRRAVQRVRAQGGPADDPGTGWDFGQRQTRSPRRVERASVNS